MQIKHYFYIGIAVFMLLMAVKSYHQVNAGHVGLVYQFGNIVGERDAGATILPPWQSLREVNVQEQKARFYNPRTNNEGKIVDEDKDMYGRIDAGSEDTQNVYIDATVNYRVERGTVRDLYTEVGPDFFTRLIRSRVHDITKSTVATYDAVEVTRKRGEVSTKVVQQLNALVNPYGITVVSMQLDNLGYTSEFEKAIEEKQVATQNALRAQEQVAQAQAEARSAQAKAKGEADSAIERARGEAERIKVTASAQAEANLKVAQSLTPALIQSQAIGKWSGNMPAILPNGGGVIIDPASLFKP